MNEEDNEHNDPNPTGDLWHEPEPAVPTVSTDTKPAKKPHPKWSKQIHNTFISLRQKTADLTAKYPNALGYAKTIANAVQETKFQHTPWALAKGAFSLLSDLSGDHFYDITSLCNPNDGWKYLTSRSRANIGFLFRDVVESLPSHKIKFRNNTSAEVYDFHGYQLFYTQNGGASWWLYFNTQQISVEALLKMLVAEKFKVINTNFLFVKETNVSGDNQLTVLPVWPSTRASTKATEIKKMLEAFIAEGHNRSLFLYGMPGCGKSTIAQTVLAEMGFRTIVFSASNTMVSFELVRDLCEMFSIEAVIIDDFDQFSNTNKNLDVLEYFNREVKVLIGIANSMNGFHPAVMRPGRFDEPIVIEALDKECVEEILGTDLSARFYEQVKEFPISYINELRKKSQFLDETEQAAYVEELGVRVERSKKRLELPKDFNSLL